MYSSGSGVGYREVDHCSSVCDGRIVRESCQSIPCVKVAASGVYYVLERSRGDSVRRGDLIDYAAHCFVNLHMRWVWRLVILGARFSHPSVS